MTAFVAGIQARMAGLASMLAAWKQKRLERRSDRVGGSLPVRDQLHIPGTRSVRLTVFDQSLVSVVAALLLLGVVGFTLFVATMMVVVNLLVDVLYAVVDPRVRY